MTIHVISAKPKRRFELVAVGGGGGGGRCAGKRLIGKRACASPPWHAACQSEADMLAERALARAAALLAKARGKIPPRGRPIPTNRLMNISTIGFERKVRHPPVLDTRY